MERLFQEALVGFVVNVWGACVLSDNELVGFGIALGFANVVWLWLVSMPRPRPQHRKNAKKIGFVQCIQACARSLYAAVWTFPANLLKRGLMDFLFAVALSFSGGKQREGITLTLFTLPGSAKGETVRWALEACGEIYEERVLSEFLLRPLVRVFTGSAIPSYGAPLLVTGRSSKRAVCDLSPILRHLGTRHRALFPCLDATDIESYVSSRFADAATRLSYAYMLAKPAVGSENAQRDLFAEVTTRNLFRWQRWLMGPLQSAAARDVKHRLRLTEQFEANKKMAEHVFFVMDKFLTDDRPFLAGEELTVADIIFCGLASPLLLPPETTDHLPILDKELPTEYADMVRGFRETRSGRHALLMYAKWRRPFEDHRHAPGKDGRGSGSGGRRKRGRSRSAKQTVNSKTPSPVRMFDC